MVQYLFLTDEQGVAVSVNLQQVSFFKPHQRGTIFYFNGSQRENMRLIVNESYEEITNLTAQMANQIISMRSV